MRSIRKITSLSMGFRLRVMVVGLLVSGSALAVSLYAVGTAHAPAASASSLPALSGSLITAVNYTGMTIAPVGANEASSASVSEANAVSAALGAEVPGSTAVAVQLFNVTSEQYPNGGLVWVIQVLPAGGYFALAGPAGKNGPAAPPARNYKVDLVDASTGQWVMGSEGYSSALAGS